MSESANLTFYLAQAIGAAGFFLVFIAPLMRAKPRFILLDVAGLIPVTAHYILLGAPVGALLCALYIAIDLVSAGYIKHPYAKRGYWVFYVFAGAATLLFYNDARDLIALVGTLLAVASRQQSDYAKLKFLIFVSAIAWGVYGYVVESFSQIVFSVFYTASSLYGAFDEVRRRPPPL